MTWAETVPGQLEREKKKEGAVASPMGFGPDGGRGRPRRGSLGRAWELGQARAARIWSWAWRCAALAGEAGPAHEGGGGRPRRGGALGRTRGPRRSQRGRSSSPDRIGEAGRGGDPWRRRRRGWATSRRGNGAGEAGTADPGPAGPDPVDPGRVRVKTWPAAANSMASGPYCGELGVAGELLRRAGRGGAEERRRGPGSGSRKFRTTAARASAGLRWACRADAMEE